MKRFFFFIFIAILLFSISPFALADGVSIVSNPENITVVTGSIAYFSVAASGDNLSYQWQYSSNGSSWSNVGTTIPSARTNYLHFTAQARYNNYLYRCVISDSSSSVTSNSAKLTVLTYDSETSSQVSNCVSLVPSHGYVVKYSGEEYGNEGIPLRTADGIIYYASNASSTSGNGIIANVSSLQYYFPNPLYNPSASEGDYKDIYFSFSNFLHVENIRPVDGISLHFGSLSPISITDYSSIGNEGGNYSTQIYLNRPVHLSIPTWLNSFYLNIIFTSASSVKFYFDDNFSIGSINAQLFYQEDILNYDFSQQLNYLQDTTNQILALSSSSEGADRETLRLVNVLEQQLSGVQSVLTAIKSDTALLRMYSQSMDSTLEEISTKLSSTNLSLSSIDSAIASILSETSSIRLDLDAILSRLGETANNVTFYDLLNIVSRYFNILISKNISSLDQLQYLNLRSICDRLDTIITSLSHIETVIDEINDNITQQNIDEMQSIFEEGDGSLSSSVSSAVADVGSLTSTAGNYVSLFATLSNDLFAFGDGIFIKFFLIVIVILIVGFIIRRFQ